MEVQHRLDAVLDSCNTTLKDSRTAKQAEAEHTEVQPDGVTLVRGEAARQLQKLCPACFGASKWGRNLDEYVSFISIYQFI